MRVRLTTSQLLVTDCVAAARKHRGEPIGPSAIPRSPARPPPPPSVRGRAAGTTGAAGSQPGGLACSLGALRALCAVMGPLIRRYILAPTSSQTHLTADAWHLTGADFTTVVTRGLVISAVLSRRCTHAQPARCGLHPGWPLVMRRLPVHRVLGASVTARARVCVCGRHFSAPPPPLPPPARSAAATSASCTSLVTGEPHRTL